MGIDNLIGIVMRWRFPLYGIFIGLNVVKPDIFHQTELIHVQIVEVGKMISISKEHSLCMVAPTAVMRRRHDGRDELHGIVYA